MGEKNTAQGAILKADCTDTLWNHCEHPVRVQDGLCILLVEDFAFLEDNRNRCRSRSTLLKSWELRCGLSWFLTLSSFLHGTGITVSGS